MGIVVGLGGYLISLWGGPERFGGFKWGTLWCGDATCRLHPVVFVVLVIFGYTGCDRGVLLAEQYDRFCREVARYRVSWVFR